MSQLLCGRSTDICWAEDRDAAKYPKEHTMSLQQRIILTQMTTMPRLGNPSIKESVSSYKSFVGHGPGPLETTEVTRREPRKGNVRLGGRQIRLQDASLAWNHPSQERKHTKSRE